MNNNFKTFLVFTQIIFVFLVGFFTSPVSAEHSDTLVLSSEMNDAIAAGKFSSSFIGEIKFSDQIPELEEIPFEKIKSDYVSLGLQEKTVWLKTDYIQTDNSNWVLELTDPRHEFLTVREYCDSKLIQYKELDFRTVSKIWPMNFFDFPLQGKGTCTILISLSSSDAVTLPIIFRKAESLSRARFLKNLGFGLFFGILFSLSIYNFLLFLSIKDIAYLWYVCYIMTFSFFYAVVYGYFGFIFGNPLENSISRLIMISSILTSLFALQFAKTFLQISSNFPAIAKVVNFTLVSAFPLLIVQIFVPLRTGILLGNIYPVLCVIMVIISTVTSLRSGYKPARYFALAWAFLLISINFFVAENLGLISANAFTHYSQLFGTGLEVVLLSLALGYRINDLRQKEALIREEMISKERQALEKEKASSASFQRFVPGQFIKILGKQSILEVKTGDANAMQMAVLFTDIRGFTSLAEKIGTRETFDFLNKYLAKMNPAIEKNNGFIDKFIGDAIMALFPDGASAVAAAVEMQKLASQFSLPDGQPLKSGFGVHFGELILGTLGSDNRLETTVIGDTVNSASRIEALTKEYNSDILISGDVYKTVSDYRFMREIDTIKLRGKTKPVAIFEVFENDEETIKNAKLQYMSLFLSAQSLFQAGELEKALLNLKQCQVYSIHDLQVARWIARIDQIILKKD